MSQNRTLLMVLGLLSVLPIGTARAESAQPAAAPREAAAAPLHAAAGLVADASHAWLLHLSGVSGLTMLDRGMIDGLRDGGYDGIVETYDWVGANPGIPALLASKRNHEEARKIADQITARVRADPSGQIILTAHSGGTGLCVWALEDLPDEVKVDTILLLAPALSQQYDLTRALTHVRGKLYVFSSPGDAFILGAGTSLFGTIDGVKAEAAGKNGFRLPDNAAAATRKLYDDRLVPKPYDPAWLQYGNIGDHLGVLRRPFSQAILTPTVLADLPPKRPAALTTRPTTPPR